VSNLLGGREIGLQDIDLADAEVHSSGLAVELFRILRDRAPVHWNESRGVWAGFWSITRYEDVQKISRDPKTFSSERDFKLIPEGAPEESMLYNGMGPHAAQHGSSSPRSCSPTDDECLHAHVRPSP
jgi:hypothetical protein